MDTVERRRLDSWKEIAQYLRRDVTTVIRWEHGRGLPVHRVPGGKLSRVFAYTNELDEWLHHANGAAQDDLERAKVPAALEDPPRGTRRRRFAFLATTVTVLLLVIVIVAAFLPRRSQAGSAPALSIAGNTLIARDSDGKRLWEHVFDAAPQPISSGGLFLTNDIDDDGAADPLAAVSLRTGTMAAVDSLHRFSLDGRLLWSYTPPDHLSLTGRDYGPPWASGDLATFRAAGQTRIAWAVHHYTWWPSMLIALDRGGQRVGTFVNFGWISLTGGTRDGKYLLALGMANPEASYFLAVLDAREFNATAPDPPGQSMHCENCPAGAPLDYYVFPRSDLSASFAYPLAPPGFVVGEDGTIAVHVLETPGPSAAATIYEFGSDLRLREARVNDAQEYWHHQLERAGALRHTLRDCRARRRRELQHWTRERGWEAIPVDLK